MNCKDVVISICADVEVSININRELYDCEKLKFCDPHHKLTITGDLGITGNKKCRKLLIKDAMTENPTKQKIETSILTPRKESVLNMVKQKFLNKTNII